MQASLSASGVCMEREGIFAREYYDHHDVQYVSTMYLSMYVCCSAYLRVRAILFNRPRLVYRLYLLPVPPTYLFVVVVVLYEGELAKHHE